MAVGAALTKGEFDALATDISRAFQKAFNQTLTMQSTLNATPNADLEALGYTPDDVATLKTAFSDLEQLARIWAGAEALAAPKDFRTFVRRLWGVGAF